MGPGSAERLPTCLAFGLWLAISLTAGCGSSQDFSVSGGTFSGTAGGSFGGAPAFDSGSQFCFSKDADLDGIDDALEGTSDPDGDGLPNSLDPDSDDDGILDRDEAQSIGRCAPPRDCDADGQPDAYDIDSDNDFLADKVEFSVGTSLCNRDTDNDGCQDFAELELGTCDASHVFVRGCSNSLEQVVGLTVAGAAQRLDVHLEVVKLMSGFELAWIDGVEPFAVNPEGAATISGHGFSEVLAGATLTVKVRLNPVLGAGGLPWTLIAVRARTPDGTVFGEGLLLVVIDRCSPPIPI